MSKVFVAIPNLRWLCTPLALTIPRWLRDHQGCIVYAPEMLKPLAYARNFCVEKFLETDATHFFIVDADIAPAPGVLEHLLSAEVAVIAAKVNQLKLDDDGIMKPCPMLMRRDEEGNFKAAYGKGIGQIDRAGFACVLFTRAVFEKIKCPWFEQRPWGLSRGTDFNFCEKMEETNIPLFGHFDMECKQLVSTYI